MKVKDLAGLVEQLEKIIENHGPEVEIVFTDQNCWRTLLSREKFLITPVFVEVKRSCRHFAPVSVVNDKRGFIESYKQKLLAKETISVLHLQGY